MLASAIRRALAVPWHHGDYVDFSNTVVEGPLDLSGLNLTGVDFSNTCFPDGLDARQARFNGLAWFQGAEFGKPALLSKAVFFNDARFDDVRFADAAVFDDVEFRGIGRFDHARFDEGVSFERIAGYGNFSLHHTAISGFANFRGAEWLGGFWGEEAQLPEATDLAETIVHGRLWLRRARLGGAALDQNAYGMIFGYAYS